MCLSLILEHIHFLLFWQLISQCHPFGYHLYQRTVRTIISENNLMSHCLGSGSDYRTYWSYLCIQTLPMKERTRTVCLPGTRAGPEQHLKPFFTFLILSDLGKFLKLSFKSFCGSGRPWTWTSWLSLLGTEIDQLVPLGPA